MALPITCPGCAAAFEVPESLAGKTIRCTSCKTQLTVPAAAEPLPLDAEPLPLDDEPAPAPAAKTAPAAKSVTKTAVKAAVVVDDDDDEDEKTNPSKSSNKSAKSGTVAKSATKRRRDDDDDDDEDDFQPPKKKKKNQSGGSGKMIALIGGGVVALAGIVVACIFLFGGDKEKKKDDTASTAKPDTPADARPTGGPGGGQRPGRGGRPGGGAGGGETGDVNPPSNFGGAPAGGDQPAEGGMTLPGKPGRPGAGGGGRPPAGGGGAGAGGFGGFGNPFAGRDHLGTPGAWATHAGDGYTVEFPGTPETISQAMDAGGFSLTLNITGIGKDGADSKVFVVVSAKMPAVVPAAQSDMVLDGAIAGMGQSGGHATNVRKITVDGFPGREADVTEKGMAGKARVILARDHLLVLVAGNPGAPADATRFLNSFKVTVPPDGGGGGIAMGPGGGRPPAVPGQLPLPGAPSAIGGGGGPGGPPPGISGPPGGVGGPGQLPLPGGPSAVGGGGGGVAPGADIVAPGGGGQPPAGFPGRPPIPPGLGGLQPGGGPDGIGGGQPPSVGGGGPQRPPVGGGRPPGGGPPRPPGIGGGIGGQPPGGPGGDLGVGGGGGLPGLGGGVPGRPGLGGGQPGGQPAANNPPPGVNADGKLKYKVEPFFAAAFDADKKEFFTVSVRDEVAPSKAIKKLGWLNQYNYPAFNDKRSYKIPHVGTRVVLDPTRQLLYVATVNTVNPTVEQQQFDQAAAVGDVQVFDLATVRDGKVKSEEELKPVATLAIGKAIRGMELCEDGKSLVVLTTTTGRPAKSQLHKYDTTELPKPLKPAGPAKDLPEAGWDMCKSADGKNLLIVEMPNSVAKTAAVRIFDPVNMSSKTRPLGGVANDVTEAPGGQIVAAVAGVTAGDHKLTLFTENTGSLDLDLGFGWKAANNGWVKFSPDGKTLFVSSYRARGLDVYEVTDLNGPGGLKKKASIQTASLQMFGGHFYVSPDGEYVVDHHGIVLETANIGGSNGEPVGGGIGAGGGGVPGAPGFGGAGVPGAPGVGGPPPGFVPPRQPLPPGGGPPLPPGVGGMGPGRPGYGSGGTQPRPPGGGAGPSSGSPPGQSAPPGGAVPPKPGGAGAPAGGTGMAPE